MKKFFTLIAAVVMAASANAQGSYILSAGDAVTAGQQVTSVDNITLTYGAGSGSFVAAKKQANWADADFQAYTNGSANGKFTEATETAEATEPTGCFYKFDAAENGTLTVAIQLNSGKGFYVINGDYQKVAYSYNLPSAKDGDSQSFTQNEKGQDIIDAKSNGTVTFNVEKGKSYYVFCVGSKLAFFGFKYTVGTTGIKDVKAAANAADAATYNMAGQKVGKSYKGVVIKNGKKTIQK